MRIEIDKEEYKDLIETKEEFVKTVKKLENIIIENIKLTDNLQAKKQECKHWKNQCLCLDGEDVTVQITQEQFEEYRKLKKQLKNELDWHKQADKVDTVNHIYTEKLKQALKEIEKYQKRNCETCVYANTQKCNINCQAFVIFDIINKAKDGE